MSSDAPILVAADCAANAMLVRRHLSKEFVNVAISIETDQAVPDFEHFKPEILILSYDTLEEAEQYYLRLSQFSTQISDVRHQVIVLCSKNEQWQAYEQCQKKRFDDYVIFWPDNIDGPRLQMVTHNALMRNAEGPNVAEISASIEELVGSEARLGQYATQGVQFVEEANQCISQAETGVSKVFEELSSKLSESELITSGDGQNSQALQAVVAQLKNEDIKKYFQSATAAVQPMREWAGTLKNEISTHIDSIRSLQKVTKSVRPVVLMVDDDPFQHKMVRQLLSDVKLEVICAESGNSALSLLQSRMPDIVLMDFNMPDVNGIEVTRKIKANESFYNLPILMVTGHSERDVVVESLRAGASDFVVKPFNKATLLSKLSKFLNKEYDKC